MPPMISDSHGEDNPDMICFVQRKHLISCHMCYTVSMNKRQREIYILVNAAKCSGRRVLQGFLSSVDERTDFRLHICEMSEYGR